jgi:uncharacterized protein YbjT (DUF2867 family)
VGKPTLQALLDAKQFNITIVTRSDSSTEFPTSPSITVKSADYASQASLASSLRGNEALILMLNFQALGDVQMALIDAAAEAGVQWILPTEYGADNANSELAAMVPVNAMKTAPRRHVEEVAGRYQGLGLSWVGVVTNPWFDYVC